MDQPRNIYEIPFDGSESTRAARESIDSDIHKLEENIFALRRHRNRLSSIAVLPPEVLSKIFVFTRDASLSAASPPATFHHFQWISAVTHICHHWRLVALGCPTLWSIPLFTRPDVAREMMRRSKMAALTIRSAGTWTPRIVEQLENAMTQIPRIKILELSFAMNPDKLKNIFASFSQPAPLLEELSLNVNSYQPLNNQKGLPDNAFKDAPLLQSIKLDRLNFSWQAAIFRHQTVTALRLTNNRVSPDESSTFGQMIEVLANMPNIQTLHLKSVIPSHSSASGDEGILQLNFLKSLSIEARVPECVQLLRCIQYPPRTQISIRSYSNSFEEWLPLISLVSQAMRGIPTMQNGDTQTPYRIKEVIIDQKHTSTLTIGLYDKLNGKQLFSALDGRPASESAVTLRLEASSSIAPSPSPDRILRDVFDSFNFPGLEVLHLDLFPGYWQPSVLQECVGSLPKLKHLRMQGYAMSLFDAITEDLEGREAPPPIEPPDTSSRTRSSTRRRRLQCAFPPVTIFPSLRTLQIENAELREGEVPGGMDKLIDMLRQRSDMNAPIDKLELRNCLGVRSSRRRKRLAEVVVDLVIDGEDVDIANLSDIDDFIDDEESEEENYDYMDYDSDSDYDDNFYDFEDAFGFLPFYH